jgi:hypothetical protein
MSPKIRLFLNKYNWIQGNINVKRQASAGGYSSSVLGHQKSRQHIAELINSNWIQRGWYVDCHEIQKQHSKT